MSDSIEELAGRLGLVPGEVESIRDGILAQIAKVKPSLAQFAFEPGTRFEEVGMNSLKMISVIFEVEEFFGIDIVGRNLEDVRTFGETVAVVARLVAEKRNAPAAA